MTVSPILSRSLGIVLLILIPISEVAAAKSKLRFEHYDNLFVARCEAECLFKFNKNECIKLCLKMEFVKPGECPKNATSLSLFASACIRACDRDTQCPGVAKCCQHRCGITCQHPKNINSLKDIPDVPRDLIVTEGRRKKTVYVEWKPGGLTRPHERIIYVLEERHHVGREFNEDKLSHWTVCARTSKLVQTLKNFVKPGSWYQFRVAAVNENGTRGYSDNSFTFSISVNPKPPKEPQNMTVVPIWIDNDTLSVELSWDPPQSDLPIQKYKVFWSRRLQGARALDSVLVHQQVVSRDQTKYLIKDLQPKSLYFLQVQAIVQFGNERLKGEKSGFVLNTTSYTNFTNNEITPMNLNIRTKTRGLHLEKFFWSQGQLKARISWKGKKGTARYNISWWIGSCDENYENNRFKVAATTKAFRFDLYDLQFDCRYKVRVKGIETSSNKPSEDITLTFSTPTCTSFKNMYKRAGCVNSFRV